MLSVTEALKLIDVYCQKGSIIRQGLAISLGYVLAEDVLSPINMPPFRQSSMDGYAFILSKEKEYAIIGEAAAGSNNKNIQLKTGEAVQIFTGARIPNEADTVVIQENTTQHNSNIIIDPLPVLGSNIRPIGMQIRAGEVALKKGSVLNESAIGFLASLGIIHINVYKKPKVSILITGNELQHPGEVLTEGKIFESNSITLNMALQRYGIKDIEIDYVKDTLEATTDIIKTHLEKSDIILISGGISVGKYDFVKQALYNNKVTEVFYKVNQKPGKPLWFGYKSNTKVFALPGNPASSLTCLYVYVLPIIKAALGYEEYHLPRYTTKAKMKIENKFGKTLFLKGSIEADVATALEGQASSILQSFALCNSLLIIPEEKEGVEQGEELMYLKINDHI